MTWAGKTLSSLDSGSLRELVDRKVAYLRLPAFYPAAHCERAVKALGRRDKLSPYSVEDVGKIGITVMDHNPDDRGNDCSEGRRKYFAAQEKSESERKAIFGAQTDPVDAVADVLDRSWPTGAGRAYSGEHGRPYFAGIVRNVTTAPIHNDWAKRDAPDWEIGQIIQQLTWNIYLQMPASGGEIVLYQKLWSREDAKHMGSDSFFYESEVVSGWPSVRFRPEAGDLVLFDPTHFHEVTGCVGDRARWSISSFIGIEAADKPLVMWS